MKRNFTIIYILIVLFVAQHADAKSTFTLKEGWGLVSADVIYSLDIDNLINNGGALYLLNPDDKKYYGGSGNPESVKNDIERIQSRPSGDNIVGLGFWLYTPKSLSTQVDFLISVDRLDYYQDSYKLIKGWNFVAVTSLMSGKSPMDVKGSCKYVSVYNFENGEWHKQTDVDMKEKFTTDSLGHAFAVKVENDCSLNFSKSAPSIPSLPN